MANCISSIETATRAFTIFDAAVRDLKACRIAVYTKNGAVQAEEVSRISAVFLRVIVWVQGGHYWTLQTTGNSKDDLESIGRAFQPIIQAAVVPKQIEKALFLNLPAHENLVQKVNRLFATIHGIFQILTPPPPTGWKAYTTPDLGPTYDSGFLDLWASTLTNTGTQVLDHLLKAAESARDLRDAYLVQAANASEILKEKESVVTTRKRELKEVDALLSKMEQELKEAQADLETRRLACRDPEKEEYATKARTVEEIRLALADKKEEYRIKKTSVDIALKEYEAAKNISIPLDNKALTSAVATQKAYATYAKKAHELSLDESLLRKRAEQADILLQEASDRVKEIRDSLKASHYLLTFSSSGHRYDYKKHETLARPPYSTGSVPIDFTSKQIVEPRLVSDRSLVDINTDAICRLLRGYFLERGGALNERLFSFAQAYIDESLHFLRDMVTDRSITPEQAVDAFIAQWPIRDDSDIVMRAVKKHTEEIDFKEMEKESARNSLLYKFRGLSNIKELVAEYTGKTWYEGTRTLTSTELSPDAVTALKQQISRFSKDPSLKSALFAYFRAA
jgi:hypothetical protein